LCTVQYSAARTSFLCGDAAHMPFSGASFDVLLNLESSHCYPDFDAFLVEVRRVLKPGGLFAFADLWGLSKFPYDWDLRRTALERCGLTLLREQDVSDGIYRALKRDDGLSNTVREALTEENAPLVEAILRGNEAMRLTVATRQCSYTVMLMRKTSNG
ncbi:MAG: class I SAM-dependent methyltransferase, partial [Bryobacteraceae bacterium]